MAIIEIPGLSIPNCTSMAASIWFKVTNFNGFEPDNPNPPITNPATLGAGAYFGGGGTIRKSDGAGVLYSPQGVWDPYTNDQWSNPFPLMEWGDQSHTDPDIGIQSSNSGIYLTPSKHVIFLSGGKYYPPISAAPGTGVYGGIVLSPNPGGSYSDQLLIANASELNLPAWNHLFVTCDLSGPDVWPHAAKEIDPSSDPPNNTFALHPLTMSLTQNSLMSIVCNNVKHTAGVCQQVSSSFNNGFSDVDGSFSPSEPGDAQYLTFGPTTQVFGTDTDRNTLPGTTPGSTNPSTELFGGSGWSMPCLSGFEAAYYNYPTIAFAAVQVWFNQYIDPSAQNLAKFIRPSDGKLIAPVKYDKNGNFKSLTGAAADDAFGRPDLLFDGNHTQFLINRGSAGSATGGGSIADYTPYPSGKG